MNKESIKIGGKGSIRRKKKRNSSLALNIRKNPSEIKLIKTIDKINLKIKELNNDNYEIFLAYIDNIHYNFLCELNKHDFKNKNHYIKFKEQPYDFFDKLFIINININPIQYNNSLENLYLYLSKDLVKFLINFFNDILTCLDNKTYLEQDINNDDFKDITLSECYNFFDLKMCQDITNDELKIIYRKKALLLHPDKHLEEKEKYEELFKEMNKYYKFILHQDKDKSR